MPRFDQFKRRLHSSVDGMFAERVRIVGLEGWPGRSGAAGTRDRCPIWLKRIARTSLCLVTGRAQFSGNVRTGGAVLKPDPAVYPDLDVRQGDDVIALERPGETALARFFCRPAAAMASSDYQSGGTADEPCADCIENVGGQGPSRTAL